MGKTGINNKAWLTNRVSGLKCLYKKIKTDKCAEKLKSVEIDKYYYLQLKIFGKE